MKIWEEILHRLRNGEPSEVVRRDYRSDSQIAKALRVYVDELSKEAEQGRDVEVFEVDSSDGLHGAFQRGTEAC